MLTGPAEAARLRLAPATGATTTLHEAHSQVTSREEGGTFQDMERQELTETRRKGGDSVFGGQGCGKWGVGSGEGEKMKRIFLTSHKSGDSQQT